MTQRGRALLLLSLGALFSGLSLGGRIFYLSALFAWLALGYALLSVLLVRRRLSFSSRLASTRTPRGEDTTLAVTLPRRGLLPTGALTLHILMGEERSLAYASLGKRQTQLTLPVPAQHVGVFPCGAESVSFSDALGLFELHVRARQALPALLVLPRPFEVAPLRFLTGEDGAARPNRTMEDLAFPEDVRAYRSGDALKRVHWKLSARKRELIVRKFETPAPPDSLILLDCTPPAAEDQAALPALRDALCETALSVAAMQMRGGAPVRMPFYGSQAGEFLSDRSVGTALLEELLARQRFSESDDFARILQLELRRMRRTGATVIITSRLSAPVVEGVKQIRRMGPSARVYLITCTPDAPQDRPYVAQLQQSLVEVCYVTPA